MTDLFPSSRRRSRTCLAPYEPSAAVIRRATAAIRKSWSPQQRLSRSTELTDPMTVPEMRYVAGRSEYGVDFAQG
jgi:hypothetical protein